jgi:exosome complex RNA-binding protein Rrp42 (RNase PH superfamily)
MLDPISIGIRGALMDLKLPGVVPVADEGASNNNKNVDSAIPMVQLTTDLQRIVQKESSALCVTLGIFAGNSVIMADLDRSEENIARLRENCLLTIAISGNQECCGLHKFGLGSLDPSVTHHVVQAGIELGAQVSAVLDRLSGTLEN